MCFISFKRTIINTNYGTLDTLLLKRRHHRTKSTSCAWNGRRTWSNVCRSSRLCRRAASLCVQVCYHQCQQETTAHTASMMKRHTAQIYTDIILYIRPLISFM